MIRGVREGRARREEAVEGLEGSWEPATEEAYWVIGRAPGREGAAGAYRGAGDDGGRRLLRGAILYARRGIHVFPCEPGGKRPLTANAFWEATTDVRELARAIWVTAAYPLGSLRRNTAPPRFPFAAVRSPPCARARSLAMERPRPVPPPSTRLLAASAR